jgi:hypothetical protein
MTDSDRPIEIALLAAQLDTSMEIFWERLNGLTDEEYLWEPGPGALSLRPRDQVKTTYAFGKGDLAWEYESDPQPAPLRTIAWLMWHIIDMCFGRADWTDGEHRLAGDDIECSPTADAAVEQMRAAVARWRSVFDSLPPEDYAQVGRSSYPQGLDPTFPLRDILWWMNREIIHHTAEIALLRDLYQWREA